jgi:hypothetical protein
LQVKRHVVYFVTGREDGLHRHIASGPDHLTRLERHNGVWPDHACQFLDEFRMAAHWRLDNIVDTIQTANVVLMAVGEEDS